MIFFLEVAEKEAKVLCGSGECGLERNGSDFLLAYNFLISSVVFLREQRHDV